MKRKLPPLRPGAQYIGPAGAQAILNVDPTGFALWARVDFPDAAPDLVVRVARLKTHEIPGSKWVEFFVTPCAVLIDGTLLYPLLEFQTDASGRSSRTIKCEWSDFLRLVRWRKQVLERPIEDQAKIARVIKNPLASGKSPVYLMESVDHPVRKAKAS